MSNMYAWVDRKRNFIGGKCPHECEYCYVQRMNYPKVKERYSGELRLLEDEFKKNEGQGHTVFVCDCNDMFAEAVPEAWIDRILGHCLSYPENTYLFQTKNPHRFLREGYPPKTLLGITLETNRDETYKTKALPCAMRRLDFKQVKDRLVELGYKNIEYMVNIEPIMDFDLDEFVCVLRDLLPLRFISIGADSKGSNLPEPSVEKTAALVDELRKLCDVRIKINLNRITQAKKEMEVGK